MKARENENVCFCLSVQSVQLSLSLNKSDCLLLLLLLLLLLVNSFPVWNTAAAVSNRWTRPVSQPVPSQSSSCLNKMDYSCQCSTIALLLQPLPPMFTGPLTIWLFNFPFFFSALSYQFILLSYFFSLLSFFFYPSSPLFIALIYRANYISPERWLFLVFFVFVFFLAVIFLLPSAAAAAAV